LAFRSHGVSPLEPMLIGAPTTGLVIQAGLTE
jgi:hypothetical protein